MIFIAISKDGNPIDDFFPSLLLHYGLPSLHPHQIASLISYIHRRAMRHAAPIPVWNLRRYHVSLIWPICGMPDWDLRISGLLFRWTSSDLRRLLVTFCSRMFAGNGSPGILFIETEIINASYTFLWCQLLQLLQGKETKCIWNSGMHFVFAW